jgi:hypothetical protein
MHFARKYSKHFYRCLRKKDLHPLLAPRRELLRGQELKGLVSYCYFRNSKKRLEHSRIGQLEVT